MFENVIEAAIKRRRELQQILKLFYEKGGKQEELVLKPLPPKPNEVLVHGAEDGGHRIIDLEAYSIYIIKAYALCMKNADGKHEIPYEKTLADVNVVIPSQYIDERVSIYREIAELWISREIIRKCRPEVFFWDGSLRPLLIRHRPGAYAMKGFNFLFEKALDRLSTDLEPEGLAETMLRYSDKEPLSVQRMIKERLNVEELVDDDADWIAFLEWLEKLLMLSSFLREGWENNSTLVFVTKTSRSTSILKRALPDIYYIRLSKPFGKFRTVGHIRRTAIEVIGLSLNKLKTIGPLFPRVSQIYEIFMKRLGLIEFYARLDDAAPALKFEIAIDLNKFGLIDYDVVETVIADTLERMLSVPMTNGYPLSLKLAHQRSRVEGREVEKVLQALGIELERKGREVLR